jgi:glycosyltransferase involved in cell wall biosynthesis
MISVCIPVRNDPVEANATIRSVRETAGGQVELIILDDGSDIPLKIDDPDVVFRRINGRAGVGPARHICATMASQYHLFFLDSHMRLPQGWYEKAIAKLESNPDTLWSCSCAVLNENQMDLSKATSIQHGASINFFGPHKKKPQEMQVLEPNWLSAPQHPPDGGEIQCVLGAAYLMPRSLFFRVGGMRMLRDWGVSDIYLSLKVWLAGGECRLARDIVCGHQFRKATSYRSKTANILHNKIMLAMTMFPEDAAKFIVEKLREQVRPETDFKIALNVVREQQPQIEVERAFNDVVFERDLDWFLQKFNLPRFWEG